MFLIISEICRKTGGPAEKPQNILFQCLYIEPPLLPICHLNSLAEAVINLYERDYGAEMQGHYSRAVSHLPNVHYTLALLLAGCAKVMCMLLNE